CCWRSTSGGAGPAREPWSACLMSTDDPLAPDYQPAEATKQQRRQAALLLQRQRAAEAALDWAHRLRALDRAARQDPQAAEREGRPLDPACARTFTAALEEGRPILAALDRLQPLGEVDEEGTRQLTPFLNEDEVKAGLALLRRFLDGAGPMAAEVAVV